VAAHEPEAFVDDVENAGGVGVAGSLGLSLEDLVDQLLPAIGAGSVDLELAPDLAELGDTHLTEVADVEVVPLASSFDFLLLLELRDGSAHGGW